MWSSVNNKPDKWERLTGREYGFESGRARDRRIARDWGSEDDAPGGQTMSQREMRALERDAKAREKEIKQLRTLRARLESKRVSHEAAAGRCAKAGDRAMANRAARDAASKKKEIDNIDKQLRKLGA